jgi:hypothetical protein
MSLKDTLNLIANSSQCASLCKFGRIYTGMDEDTQDALRSAVTSGATTMDICRALNDDGIKIRREFLAEKRKCFSSHSASCCMNTETNGATK